MQGIEEVSVEIFDSVVKIFAVSSTPNYFQPWQMQYQRHSTSSGFMIQGNYILCNAHGVVHARSVLIRKHGDFKKYNANILKIDHECDLALLQVEDSKFWENTKTLEFGEIPDLQATVVAIGYPTGGDNISVTKGVVSRVGFVEYAHGFSSLIAIQTDAAINPGNSGGPMLKGNKVIGVVFEHLQNAQNIGYGIPVMIVNHFLNDKPAKIMPFSNSQNSENTNNNDDDAKSIFEEYDVVSVDGSDTNNNNNKNGDANDGKNNNNNDNDNNNTNTNTNNTNNNNTNNNSTNNNTNNNNMYNLIPNKTIITQGFPKLGIVWEAVENPYLKQSLKMDENTHQGICINEILPLTGGCGKLLENDVILSYDGIQIADDGTIEYKKNSRISHDYITIQKYVNDKANLTILRDGVKQDVTLNVEKIPRLVPKHYYDKQSKDLSYFIFGGFVFLPLSLPYLRSYYGDSWSKSCPINLCHVALLARKEYNDEEVVILSCVLADQINIGYHHLSQAIITKCNGIEIRNIAQLSKICDECGEQQKKYVTFEIQRDYDKKVCVLDTKVAREQTSQILSEHQITHDRSFNLRQYQKHGYPVFSFLKDNKNNNVEINNNHNDETNQ